MPRAQIAQGLLDLAASVHHERPVAGDRFAERARRREQESAAGAVGPRLDEISVAKDDQRRRSGPRVIRAEANLALVQVGERRVTARHQLAE